MNPMDIDELEQELEQEAPREKRFERDQDIAQHLFGVEKYPGQSVNKDSARGNNNPLELQAVRGSARIINRLELGEKLFKWDFTNIIEFFEGNRAITDVTGRSKNAAFAYLAKSDINIQQAEQMVTNNMDYGPEAEASARDKLEKKIPFLKRKEM
jgi:hypothetical protein